jgi:glycosyltransferase involved in cell wall biosynthesis
MSKPWRLSVITPCFNSARNLRETIESVVQQQYPDVEHIVVDGGSTDGTLAILNEYPQVLWTSGKDEGLYDAMNKGIARATGELILVLNSDDCLRPGAFQAVVRGFGAHPGWGACFGDVVYVDGEGREIYRREEAVYDYSILRYWNDYICHQTLYVRKAVYERIGAYNFKDYPLCSDYELILRLGREGVKVGHVPALLASFRFHGGAISSSQRLEENMRQETKRIRADYGCPRGWRGAVLSLLYRAKRQLQKLLYRGKIDLISGRRLLKKHRSEASISTNIRIDRT